MTDDPTPTRLYDEKEVAALLKRATELSREDPASRAAAGGMSLAELEDIAREAGIDPALLRRAAHELNSGGGPLRGWDRFFGEATTLVRETEVSGELPQEAFEHIVTVIQRRSDTHGHPSMLGRTLTWQSENKNNTRTLQVIVSSRDGRTTIRVEERLRQLAAGVFGGGMGGIGGGVGLGMGIPAGIGLGSPLAAVALPAGLVALTYMGARGVYKAVVRGRRSAVADVFDAVVAVVTHEIAERQVTPGPDRPPELPRG